jgi:hypothetical protein
MKIRSERFPVTDPADEESGTSAHNQIFELPINLGEVSTPTYQVITSITAGFIGSRRRKTAYREPTTETEIDRQFKYPISFPVIKVLLRNLPSLPNQIHLHLWITVNFEFLLL